jgi:hypothetical protein
LLYFIFIAFLALLYYYYIAILVMSIYHQHLMANGLEQATSPTEEWARLVNTINLNSHGQRNNLQTIAQRVLDANATSSDSERLFSKTKMKAP